MFSYLVHQILDLPQVSIYARSVQGCLAFLVPLVPLKQEIDTIMAEGETLKTYVENKDEKWLIRDSPFLLFSFPIQSCHNPPNHHLQYEKSQKENMK